MYDDVLVPTGGSEGARRAVEEAIDLAALTDATLHALYAVDADDYAAFPDAKWVTIEETLREEGEDVVEEVATAARERGVDVATAVEEGRPHDVILEYADRNDVDAIVMGTHARSGVDRVLLGSVTERVVRRADQSVMTVRIDDEE